LEDACTKEQWKEIVELARPILYCTAITEEEVIDLRPEFHLLLESLLPK
jgi:hypothetical protein